MKTTETTANYKVLDQHRLKLSYYGNPRYQFSLLNESTGEVVTASTKPDYNFVYGLREHEDYLTATIRTTATGRQYIVNAKRIPLKSL